MAEKIAELDLVTAGKLFGNLMTGSSTSSSFPESFLTTSVISIESFSSLEEAHQGEHGGVRYQQDGISEAGDTIKADDDDVKLTRTIGKYFPIESFRPFQISNILQSIPPMTDITSPGVL